jgi:lactoylglutathione lyase
MIRWYDENTLVIKTKKINLDQVKDFLDRFGLQFVKEKHGNGPEHYSCTASSGEVLEIYPL